MKYVAESCEVRYVGASCTGCHTFKKYISFIKRLDDSNETICASCESILPDHIPDEQKKRYLDRIFRKELMKLRIDESYKYWEEVHETR